MESRRKFIKKIGAVSLTVCSLSTISSIVTACTTTKHINSKLRNDGLVSIPVESFGENNSLLLNVEEVEAPILVYKIKENVFTSVLMLCTHKGCHLNKTGPVLVCPCHGSEFTRQGQVLSGPADENLLKYKTSLVDGNVLIKVK